MRKLIILALLLAAAFPLAAADGEIGIAASPAFLIGDDGRTDIPFYAYGANYLDIGLGAEYGIGTYFPIASSYSDMGFFAFAGAAYQHRWQEVGIRASAGAEFRVGREESLRSVIDVYASVALLIHVYGPFSADAGIRVSMPVYSASGVRLSPFMGVSYWY